jgi:predicted Rossmann fold nucleotide-binding protein DprA/Smf involved in DNA uptake
MHAQGIDHICHRNDLRAVGVVGFFKIGLGQWQPSDHFGLVARLTRK